MSTENVNNSQNQMENSEIKSKTVDHTFRLGSNPDHLVENDKNSKSVIPEEAKVSQNFEGKKNTDLYLFISLKNIFVFLIL